jgi:hypothetical protein
VRLERATDSPAGVREAEVVIETPDGRRLFTLGRATDAVKGVGPWGFTAPTGRWRAAVRGTCVVGANATLPFVVLGPLIEGMSAEELAALRDRESVPAAPSGERPVAIYAYSIGADRLRDALQGDARMTPYLTYGLTSAHLKGAAVLILPQVQDVLDLTPKTVEALRAWVEAGGTIILTHDAVGLRWHPRLFPEVGEGIEPKSARMIETAAELPGLPNNSRVDHSFSDHITLKVTPQSEVLAREPAPSLAPVLARGHLGQGTVILMGTLPGGGGFPMTDPERTLLRALAARP